ncbi:MAG: flagellar type III secretion system protein FlhB [Pseudomonadota bacterium]
MSQQDGAERSHEATPKKLEDARRKGEIVKSQDLSVMASYAGALAATMALGAIVGQRFLDLGGAMIERAEPLSAGLRARAGGQGGAILGESLALSGLLVLPAAVAVLAVLAAQRAFVFAPSKLAPKLSRVSLLANAKNKFGPSGLFEFAKSASKMVIFCGVLGIFFIAEADRIVISAAAPPRLVPGAMADILADFLIIVVLISAAIAAIDYAWQRHSHLAKNRMTRQEVLDEIKQSEGDPHLKSRRRQKAEEIAMNKMLSDVPDAAVVIVNPTHFAVALKWSPTDPTPPLCLAKGMDEIALRIREIATEANVPIFSDPPTARALHASVEIGDPVARDHFAAVAAAIRFARELDKDGKR